MEKALAINLDPLIYGTIAEIGAGQEIANWFFRAGGAAGTVAKTMSAYDMTFSDEIYGRSDRYVSCQRLRAMLDHEFGILQQRLDAKRGGNGDDSPPGGFLLQLFNQDVHFFGFVRL